mgnify:CR=1 FL=1
MKKHLLISLISLMPAFALQAQTESAADAVKNMGLGWNLGNTLDANNGTGAMPSEASYWGCQGIDSENCWGQPTTSKELIKMMKNAGFGAIRVPITWYNHMDADGKVDAAWMKRVHEVVDYVINEDLYCIINVHHDTGCDGGNFHSWIKADIDNYNENKEKFEGLWTQIAEEFKDYGQKLVFAGYNEMLDAVKYDNGKVGSWCYASFSSAGQYDEKVAKSAYEGINGYAQSFVNAVRATGGNNADRNLVVPTYAAAGGVGAGTGWNNDHLLEPLTEMNYPEDSAEGHIIFEVHSYPSLKAKDPNDAWKEKLNTMTVDELIEDVTAYLKSKGAPVIVGEWGTSNVDASVTDYDADRENYLKFVEYYVQKMKENDIATFYWMGLTDGFYRGVPAFHQPEIAECMAKAYHGKDFKGEYPEVEESEEVVCFSGEQTLEWGAAINIKGELFKSFDNDVQLSITYSLPEGADYSMMQFWYGDWDKVNHPTVIIDGEELPATDDNGTIVVNFVPGDYYGEDIPSGEITTALSFDEDTYDKILKKGFLFQGHGIVVTKVVLSYDTPSSIDGISNDQPASEVIFDLSGRQVVNPGTGIFIQGGKKMIRNK